MWCTDGATLGHSRKRKVCVGALLVDGRLHRMERAFHGKRTFHKKRAFHGKRTFHKKRAFHGKRLNYR